MYRYKLIIQIQEATENYFRKNNRIGKSEVKGLKFDHSRKKQIEN